MRCPQTALLQGAERRKANGKWGKHRNGVEWRGDRLCVQRQTRPTERGRKETLLFKCVKATPLRPRNFKLHLRNPHPSVISIGFGQMLAKVIDCAEAAGLKETQKRRYGCFLESAALQMSTRSSDACLKWCTGEQTKPELASLHLLHSVCCQSSARSNCNHLITTKPKPWAGARRDDG